MNNQKGFSIIEILLIILVISMVGLAGYYVLDKNSNSKSTEYAENLAQGGEIAILNKQEISEYQKCMNDKNEIAIENGQFKCIADNIIYYEDGTQLGFGDSSIVAPSTPGNVSKKWIIYEGKDITFYHPADWNSVDIKVQKSSVSEIVSGTKFGPYRAKLLFNQDLGNWNRVYTDFGSPDVYAEIDSDDYTYSTKSDVFSYPAIYGYVGEGGGGTYFIAITNGSTSYLIELPVILPENDPSGLDEQKKAAPEIIKTIRAQ